MILVYIYIYIYIYIYSKGEYMKLINRFKVFFSRGNFIKKAAMSFEWINSFLQIIDRGFKHVYSSEFFTGQGNPELSLLI